MIRARTRQLARSGARGRACALVRTAAARGARRRAGPGAALSPPPQNSQEPGYRGKATASRMLATPVT
jgi:hypothetical protein